MYRGQVEQVRGGHLPCRTGERPCKVARLQGETDSQQASLASVRAGIGQGSSTGGCEEHLLGRFPWSGLKWK